jgi:hypothetical protein
MKFILALGPTFARFKQTRQDRDLALTHLNNYLLFMIRLFPLLFHFLSIKKLFSQSLEFCQSTEYSLNFVIYSVTLCLSNLLVTEFAKTTKYMLLDHRGLKFLN